MTREDKAKELGYKYFPDEENIWARDNVEATKTMSACMEMSNFILDKACEWIAVDVGGWFDMPYDKEGFIQEFKKAMQQ